MDDKAQSGARPSYNPTDGRTLLLSVVIPARNEASRIRHVLASAANVLTAEEIPFELVVVDDYSSDGTAEEVPTILTETRAIRCIRNTMDPGIGPAIEFGIRRARGDVIAIMMGDGSDEPLDLIRYYDVIAAGADCAFGSRFLNDSFVEGYPPIKLLLNRLGNWLVSHVFGYRYNDFTNAFKAYRSCVLTRILPLRSQGFDVTLEIPVRTVLLDSSFEVVAISWYGRSSGHSKMSVPRDVWRYLFRLVSLRVRGT